MPPTTGTALYQDDGVRRNYAVQGLVVVEQAVRGALRTVPRASAASLKISQDISTCWRLATTIAGPLGPVVASDYQTDRIVPLSPRAISTTDSRRLLLGPELATS